MLDREFQYYLDNQDELVALYAGKVLVIIGKKVVGIYDTEIQAYYASIAKYEPGTFLVQQCTPGLDSYTQTFHTRVSFSAVR